jgi:hypothetical protein
LTDMHKATPYPFPGISKREFRERPRQSEAPAPSDGLGRTAGSVSGVNARPIHFAAATPICGLRPPLLAQNQDLSSDPAVTGDDYDLERRASDRYF